MWDGTGMDENTALWKWHPQSREKLTVSTPASSSSVTFPTMDWTDTFSRKRKWIKCCPDGASSPGLPRFLTAASPSRSSTCLWAEKEGALPHCSSGAAATQLPSPGLTEGEHLVPVSAEAGPGAGYKAVQPVGHGHGQECRHKHRAHRMNEGFCVGRDLSLQAAQARAQQHRAYAWPGGGAVRHQASRT